MENKNAEKPAELEAGKRAAENEKTVLRLSLLQMTLAVAVGLTIFEITKQQLFPNITIWQSYISTIVFGAVIATVVAYFLFRQYRRLLQQIIRETTERKQAEEVLKFQETLYRTLIETIPHVIWTGNSEGQVQFMNRAWYDWTGRSIEESLGTRWAESVHPEDTEELLAKWERAYKYGESYEGEYRFKTKDGSNPNGFCGHSFRPPKEGRNHHVFEPIIMVAKTV